MLWWWLLWVFWGWNLGPLAITLLTEPFTLSLTYAFIGFIDLLTISYDLCRDLVIILKTVFIIWSQGFIFSKWVSVERNSSRFFFFVCGFFVFCFFVFIFLLGIEFNFRAGFLCKNGAVLLSGRRYRTWEVWELLTQRWICCQIDSKDCVPRDFYCQDYFCCFFLWALKWWIHPLRLCAHCCKEKKKKRWAAESCSGLFHGDSFMRLCDVAEPCVWYRPSSFESNHRVWVEKGGFRNNQSLQNWNPT